LPILLCVIEHHHARDDRRSGPPDDGLGAFEWDVEDDVWDWSPQMYAVHGYRPGSVVPSLDLVVGHKLPRDRRKAERLLSIAGTPGFRFRNLHGIRDASGRERVVLSVGAAALREDPTRGPRRIMKGFMVDLTDARRETLARLVQVAPRRGSFSEGAPLSEREWQVLQLIAAGCSNEEIAGELIVSVNTVKTYIRTAYRKIGAHRRSQAMLWVMEHQ
jgi:DNA-binding CsgD family transcriptional regulator